SPHPRGQGRRQTRLRPRRGQRSEQARRSAGQGEGASVTSTWAPYLRERVLSVLLVETHPAGEAMTSLSQAHQDGWRKCCASTSGGGTVGSQSNEVPNHPAADNPRDQLLSSHR